MNINVQLIEYIQSNYLTILISLLRHKEISVEEAKKTTGHFLALFVSTSYEDIKTRLKKFTNENKQFQKLYIDIFNMEEKERVNAVLQKMRTYLREEEVSKVPALRKNG